jgi:peroxiredoxin
MSDNKPLKKRLLRYAAYLLTFLVGMWGGRIMLDHLTGVDEPAPVFSLHDINGKVRHLNEWNGKLVILNFWATWCPPCRKETPLFVEMQEQYGSLGLQFVGVAIDDADKVQDFMDTYGVTYPMLIGEDDAISIAKQYGNRFGALPYTVVIDRQGRINTVQPGEMTREHLQQVIKQLL